ncbi:GNAT family N-acetyltransferase [Anaerotignum sp. MB30-C6]|uniref:GNAT family N-acetyltransferase n=1 Tax=Anaerotignum sp. MB30-C6 TaxID=3070814 RepID=UPI0027DD0B25|nr:GNAT family N-acetyltransferase [Anaerotignum sp. MB30-C6]WMI80454.1 GNAT family N-acetyltransferase [Anaerotignum sp. MB30-C6]
MFERITKDTFDEVYPILEEAFPVEELREKQRQKALLDKPQYRLYGIKEDSGILQGALAMWDFNDFFYFEHLAIKPEFRNGGFGGEKLDEIIDWAGRPIVLEVEVPEDELTKRRVGFYERHGFFYNDYPYLQPPMREGQDMLPLRLMTIPQKISEDVYKRYKSLIHKIVYDYEEA